MTTRVRRSPRVTIKIHRGTYETLQEMREDIGAPISVLVSKAVEAYAFPRPGVKRSRIRKLRGSK